MCEVIINGRLIMLRVRYMFWDEYTFLNKFCPSGTKCGGGVAEPCTASKEPSLHVALRMRHFLQSRKWTLALTLLTPKVSAAIQIKIQRTFIKKKNCTETNFFFSADYFYKLFWCYKF